MIVANSVTSESILDFYHREYDQGGTLHNNAHENGIDCGHGGEGERIPNYLIKACSPVHHEVSKVLIMVVDLEQGVQPVVVVLVPVPRFHG